ncbi:MAG TPA: hypothetical protein VFQ60_01800 [Patescibacteria group bacterium]|nr:hypothetical protein [Patescibacteria group bacterium]
MPSHPLENPFEIPKERDPDHKTFVKSVLGKGSKSKPKENVGRETEFVLSAEDQKKIEAERIFGEIIVRESQALRKFFGEEIAIPPFPRQATKERILEWRRLGLELHYLPAITMAKIKRGSKGKILEVAPIEFPGWKKKPGKRYANQGISIDFFDKIKSGDLDSSALDLPGAWILVDTREKPSYVGNSDQMYQNDFLGPILEELNEKGIIKQTRINTNEPLRADSRFGISPSELDDLRVKKAIAKVMGISEEYVSLPRAIEFNVLGNLYYPEWGETDTDEWFEDGYKEHWRLYGGASLDGGLSCVSAGRCNYINGSIGFRMIARFPVNQEEIHKK